MASGGAGVGPAPNSSDPKNYIYKIDKIPDDITPGKTYKLKETLVTCLLDAKTLKKYLRITIDKIIELDPKEHSIFYSNEPPPLIPFRPSKFEVPESISVGLTDKNEYIYEVKLTPSDIHQFFKSEGNMVSFEDFNGIYKLMNLENGSSIVYDDRIVMSRIFPKNITGLFAICSLDTPLTDTQRDDALTFINENTPELLNRTNSEGMTPLMTAITKRNVTIAAALITRKVDVNIESSDGKTAADYFCENKAEYKGKGTVRQLLITNKARPGSAAIAAAAGGKPAANGGSCILHGGRRSHRTKKARKQTRRRHARKSRRTTRK